MVHLRLDCLSTTTPQYRFNTFYTNIRQCCNVSRWTIAVISINLMIFFNGPYFILFLSLMSFHSIFFFSLKSFHSIFLFISGLTDQAHAVLKKTTTAINVRAIKILANTQRTQNCEAIFFTLLITHSASDSNEWMRTKGNDAKEKNICFELLLCDETDLYQKLSLFGNIARRSCAVFVHRRVSIL